MPEQPEPTEEELERRLQKLLGEAENASSDELDEIELKLRGLEDKLESSSAERKQRDGFFDAEFEDRLEKLHAKADMAKKARDGTKSESNRRQSIDSTSSRGLGFGLALAYTMVGPLIAGYAIGWLVDKGAGSGNTWQTWGTVIGMFSGFIAVVFLLNRTSGPK